MKTTAKSIICTRVVGALMTALDRTAQAGTAADTLKLAKFLLHIAEKLGDKTVDLIPEDNGGGSQQPIK